MQTIFEVTDDDGSVSYLHMGDADHGNQPRYSNDTFAQTYFKQNKALSWSQSERHTVDLFPLFHPANKPNSSMFKSVE